MESALPRDLGVVCPANIEARAGERPGKLLELPIRAGKQGWMGFRRRRERISDADVQFQRTGAKPAAASSFEERWFLDLE